MNGIWKLGPGMFGVIMLALIVAGGLVLFGNPYKSAYEKEQPVSYQKAVEEYGDMVGYPAGDDIPVAKSIEDIRNNEYCTIEVSKANIEPTRVFRIKDGTEAGDKSSKVGRYYTSSYVQESYYIDFNFGGNLKYLARQLLWNLQNTSYGEWCVVTLENGERIYVLVDLKLLNISDKKKIKLPIGMVCDSYNMGKPTKDYDFYKVQEENSMWFVDMVGDWEETEVGDIDVMWRFILVFLIAFVVMVAGAYLYAKKKNLVD